MREKKAFYRALKQSMKIEELLNDPSIINYAMFKSDYDKRFALDIFQRHSTKRHDVAIYVIENNGIILLTKRHVLNEKKYFQKNTIQFEIKEGKTLQDILDDSNTLNYGSATTKEVFEEIVSIFERMPQSDGMELTIGYILQETKYIVLLLFVVDKNLLQIKKEQ